MTNKGSSGQLSYDDFLGHSSGGGGGAFLSNWKEEGQIDVWTVPAAPVGVRWAHSFWEISEKKEKGGAPVSEVRSYRWICHEREAILRRQRFRDDDIGLRPDPRSDDPALRCGGIVGNGRREYPPEVCPICKLQELLRSQVRAGRISWTAPLFEWKFSGADGPTTEVNLVGDFCGLFRKPKNDYSEEQRRQMSKAGVEQKDAFMSDASARCDYIMRVVDDSHPDDGIVIAPIADSLGRKIQKAFKDRIESSKGAFNPSKQTMCLRWKYDEAEDFDKRYDVVSLIEAKPSDEVVAALEHEPPSIDELLERGKVARLRAQMEKHCVLPGVPWDEVFGDLKDEADEGPGNESWDQKTAASDQSKPAMEPKPEPRPDPVVSTVAAAQATKPQPPQAAPPKVATDDEPYECEVCGGGNPPDADGNPPITCKHCGAEYDSFTGAVTYDPTKPVTGANKPRDAAKLAAAEEPKKPEPAMETPPPAGRPPARRRAKS